MSTSSSSSTGRAVWLVLAVWFVVYFGVRVFLESSQALAPSSRLALSLAPVPVFALFLGMFLRAVRSADELERRVQLEALALAFPLGLLLLTSLGLVQRAVVLNIEDWSFNHLWPMFVLLYLIGLARARRRYV
jgi:hypothetical protein